MSGAKREEHLTREEEKARRSLDELGRRWPMSPWVYAVALAVVVLVVLGIAL